MSNLRAGVVVPDWILKIGAEPSAPTDPPAAGFVALRRAMGSRRVHPGFLLVVIGLIIAGPWLTMAAARFTGRRARHPRALIAARRLAHDPRAGFRAVSGLVLALFVTTVAVAAPTTEAAKHARPDIGAAEANAPTGQLADRDALGSTVSPAPSPRLPAGRC